MQDERVAPGAAGDQRVAPPPVGRVRSHPQPSKPKPKAPSHTDGAREIVETIVFVVVLVLLLKLFLAEAFVIPTGSMATTLLGYHKDVTCQQCEYPFRLNASKEADPDEPHPQRVIGGYCPNCRFYNELPQ